MSNSLTTSLPQALRPFVSLLHSGVPQTLEERCGGLLSRTEFPLDFRNFARVVFSALPKVKHWATFNEPWCSSILGYSIGVFAQGHNQNADTEPCTAGHNLIVAHAHAVDVYRKGLKAQHQGEIGIVLNGDVVFPWDPAHPANVEACERNLEFSISWFADPIYLGDYPVSMRKQLGDRLPVFMLEEKALVKGSNDFY